MRAKSGNAVETGAVRPAIIVRDRLREVVSVAQRSARDLSPTHINRIKTHAEITGTIQAGKFARELFR